ncbi:MAG: AMP-binding protein, partial [Actinomycetota bacterium]
MTTGATVADLVRSRAGDPRTAIRFEDDTWTWDEYVRGCAQRAAYLLDHLPAGAPRHVGVLLDNGPEYLLWLGATALTGTVLVGINPTRRGAELARDVTYTDCQVVVTEQRHRSLLDGLDLGAANGRVLVIDDDAGIRAVAPYAGAPVPDGDVDANGIYQLLFTSGTSGAPKACILSQDRLVKSASILTTNVGLGPDSVLYVMMPLFHSNAVITAFCPWLISGGTAAVRRRFSASGFLPDVRKYGVTYFNYVGKPLSYILATPPRPDDADNTIQVAFGNEAADLDIERFAQRFGCVVIDGYGSTEGGANVSR